MFGSGTFYYLQFTWKTNFLLFSNLILNTGVNVGYFLYSLEFSKNKAKMLAERTNELENERNKIENLLSERDSMVIGASRLSSLNKISIYTAAIIHEITQPLNALKLAIGNAVILAENKLSIEQKTNFDQINQIIQEIQGIIIGLRSIITKGKADVELLSPQDVILKIIPIISGECHRRGIRFEENIANDSAQIEINAILLQRIIFNLSTNAIQALSFKKSDGGMLSIKAYNDSENNFYCIDFFDNSGVIKAVTEISLNFDMISDTDKEDGMGLGLAFSNSIIKSWNGRLSVSRTEQKEANLTKFRISLPLIH